MNPISFFAVKLTCFHNDREIMVGTGFLYSHEDYENPILITNYHVLTCRYPKEPESLMGQIGSSPNKITCHVWAPDGSSLHTFHINIDANTSWLEHPLRDKGVDLVGIPIIFNGNIGYTNQVTIQNNDAIPLHVASDLSIVGYPFGLAVNTHLPIWKKGIVASEPNVKVSGLDCFYIDATTKEGMSGSPVFTHEYTTQIIVSPEVHELHQRRERGEISALDFISALPAESMKNTIQVKKFKLVGIYSGRVTIGKSMPEIGIVWKVSLIEEMLTAKNWVTSEYPPF
ncbi:trypsin-like peptidase domain-containing protein [Klebsiella sp. CN_Kp098]|uniref:trypsin-like peptidase domain-containing protein n=1 Tax=unclassified Klebsiella TaxID=2608929 RepID=UPI0032B3DC1A